MLSWGGYGGFKTTCRALRQMPSLASGLVSGTLWELQPFIVQPEVRPNKRVARLAAERSG